MRRRLYILAITVIANLAVAAPAFANGDFHR
jgi:hypothetical protein